MLAQQYPGLRASSEVVPVIQVPNPMLANGARDSAGRQPGFRYQSASPNGTMHLRIDLRTEMQLRAMDATTGLAGYSATSLGHGCQIGSFEMSCPEFAAEWPVGWPGRGRPGELSWRVAGSPTLFVGRAEGEVCVAPQHLDSKAASDQGEGSEGGVADVGLTGTRSPIPPVSISMARTP